MRGIHVQRKTIYQITLEFDEDELNEIEARKHMINPDAEEICSAINLILAAKKTPSL